MARNIVTVTVGSECTPDMERLRRVGFPPRLGVQFTVDEFDDRSSHVGHWVGGVLVGLIRLTPGPDAMFERWTVGEAVIPTGAAVVDLTRVVVAPEFRRMGLFKLIMLDALLRAAADGYTTVVGATKPGREILPAMYQMGFGPSGPVVLFHDPTSGPFEIQPCVVRGVPNRVSSWRGMYAEVRDKMATNGYDVDADWSATAVKPSRTRSRTPQLHGAKS